MLHPRARRVRSESTHASPVRVWLMLGLMMVIGVTLAALSIEPSAESKSVGSRAVDVSRPFNLRRSQRQSEPAHKRAHANSYLTPMMAVVTVDTVADLPLLSACTAAPADCSLRGAVSFANSNPGSTINVPAGTYVLSIPGGFPEGFNGTNAIGDLDVLADNTTIIGAGA